MILFFFLHLHSNRENVNIFGHSFTKTIFAYFEFHNLIKFVLNECLRHKNIFYMAIYIFQLPKNNTIL